MAITRGKHSTTTMTSTHHLLLFSHLLLVGIGTFGVNGYVYSSGPLPRNPCKPKQTGRSNSRGDDCYPRMDEDYSEAFRELRNEFGGNSRETMKSGQFDWMSLMDSLEAQKDPFGSTVDKKIAKKWIEKAFDFAFEFNEDFAAAPGERDTTDEFLRKSRDWVARLYEEEDDEDEEQETEATKNREDGDSSSSHKSKPTVSSKPKSAKYERDSTPPCDIITTPLITEIVSETPESEDKSNKDIFWVSIDLPGVDRTNVDITLDGDFLLIRAERDAANDGFPIRMYKKKLPISENAVDMENLEANLKNGVLVVSAPKKQKPIEGKRKIPVF